jgi:hypothetical protein
MSRGLQFGRRAGALALFLPRRRCARRLLAAVSATAIAAMLLASASSLKARADQPQNVVGHIQGSDASVETAVAGSDTISSAEAGVDVANGSIITVHSGQAHMSLKSGGDVDICGPAKLTLLQSGGAITLALNFGRVRVQLPSSADLRIFTPTIIATPLDINGAARDVTAGLDLDDTLCVTAGSGALLLENQFSGEKLVVPQGGEFSLARGQLVPVAGEAGACQCVTLQTKEVIPPPEPSLGLTAPAHVDPPTAPATAAAANGPLPTNTAPKSSVEYSVLAHANQVRPNAPPPKPAPPEPPATEIPEYKVVLPPLTFSASSPKPPPDPTPDMVLLIRTVRVEPDWEFSGHVDPPPMNATTKSKSEAKSNAQSSSQLTAAQAPPQKKEGFWAKMKKFLSGNSS